MVFLNHLHCVEEFFGMGLFPGWIADALDGSVAPLFNNLVRAVVP